jgi:hypothetical protein
MGSERIGQIHGQLIESRVQEPGQMDIYLIEVKYPEYIQNPC